MTFKPEAEPASLLKTILANANLHSQLANMPNDAKTLVLQSDMHSYVLDHPDVREPVAFAETVEAPVQPTLRHAMAHDGFVPRRRVELLGHHHERMPDTDYRIVGELGSGGTGIVYQAHQRAIDREVAVKVLRDELALDPQARSRFLIEARVIGGLDHPNVIALHELCVDDSVGLFYSMKRIDGTSWDRRITEMSLNENLETMSRVADAIRYAHSRGLVHRDIKPENVMLGRFGEVLVADWGLAVSLSGDTSVESTVSSIGGTPAYMAPELASGDLSGVGFHTDIYLLGAVLFHIITGFPPHHGDNLLLCIQAAAQNEIRPTDVEGELMEIALKAMSTQPEDRYGSVEELVQALEHQSLHEESVRLMGRAKQTLESASVASQYEDFRVADALLREAIDVWPENKRAHETMKQLQLDFARAAASQGDLDLSLALYDAAGEAASEAAARVRRLRDQRNEGGRLVSRYSALFTNSPEAGLLTRLATGRVVETNEMFKQLFGYRDEEIIGRKISELNIWECPQRRLLYAQQLHEQGVVDNFEAVLLHKNGQRIHTLISGRTNHIASEELVVSSMRDITLLKVAENELKLSQQRLQDLQQLAGLGTWSMDLGSGVVRWSPQTFRLLNLQSNSDTPEVGLYRSLVHPDDVEQFETTLEKSVQQGTPFELRLRHRLPNGDYQVLVSRGHPIVDANGKTVEVYGVILKPDV